MGFFCCFFGGAKGPGYGAIRQDYPYIEVRQPEGLDSGGVGRGDNIVNAIG
jgi:hypothetical protein